ncbi:DUF1573 domain-containing protein [Barnesiella propionica]|uniref:DUF1573 domain-containing protein n=1 Tax=Barnesiella propionica TaxID=2981781 RepID=UPI0011CC80A9|nr:DUF1573 domain-containing protein [Barnesiella propionica]MCU6768325.1 DUF1573 domain-containing protein [Barnesiella propionica]
MKRLVIMSMMLLISVSVLCAKTPAKIKFTEKKYDFGFIAENKGPVTHLFEFTNIGESPLVIVDARASCGCTKPEFPQEPIAPGKKGAIKVIFNPEGRPGEFKKGITVVSNAKPSKNNLVIIGVVKPEQK